MPGVVGAIIDHQPPTDPPVLPALPVERSEMARLVRGHDWAATPLGPMEQWPRSLVTAVQLALNSRYPMFIWWGAELIYLYNDAYIPVLGAKHPQALGATGEETWPEIWGDLSPAVQGVLERGEPNWAEDMPLFMERHGYREETYFTFSYSPIHEDDGRIGGLFCACTEETGRVLHQRRLHTLSAIAGATSTLEDEDAAVAAALAQLHPKDHPFTLVYLLEPDGRSARLAGAQGVAEAPGLAPARLERDDPSAWPLAQTLDSAASQRVVDPLERFGCPFPGGPWPEPTNLAVVERIERAGRPIGVLVSGISPRRRLDEDYGDYLGLVAGALGTAIGGVRSLAEERRRARDLAELDRAKTVFFSDISHELRTPLALMLGPLEELLADDASVLDPDRHAVLEQAHRNGRRLLRLVNSLLEFSRIEAGRMEARFRRVELAAFTADLASAFRSACQRAGIGLEVDCRSPVDPVWVDPDLWEKVVLNLMSNAFKFTHEGRIAVSLLQEGEVVVLRVRDTGVGIPASELSRVFERFRRVPGSRGRSGEGSGIGLALVDALVRVHGGQIGVESEPGVGSTFTIRLPTGCDHLPADQVDEDPVPVLAAEGAAAYVEEAARWLPGEVDDQAAAPETATIRELGPATVLVVDDNADMRDYLVRLLSRHWRVVAAGDGRQALERVAELHPDLVVCDVMMPVMDGLSFLRELRARRDAGDLPVILLSARAGEEASVEGLRAGADDYLVKPFTAAQLQARVATQLRLQRQRRHLLEQQRELAERLARSNAELENFAFTAAHDLQAPLRMISLHLDLIEEATADQEGLDALCSRARDGAQRMRAMIHGLLELARQLEHESEPQEVDARGAVEAAVANLQAEIETSDARLEIGDLPTVRCDPRLLIQLFQNLVANAINHHHPDRTPLIRIEGGEDEQGCVFRIADNGRGIPPERQASIFEPFNRGGNGGAGLGLGLALCQRVVDRQGGRLWVESEPGVGSTFCFTMPCG